MQLRRFECFGILGLILLLVACPAREAGLRVKPGSTNTALAFIVSETKGSSQPARVRQFQILTCGAQQRLVKDSRESSRVDANAVQWRIIRAIQDSGLTTIAYGILPSSDYVEPARAQLIERGGCFVAHLQSDPGKAETVFRADSAGRIEELSDRAREDLYKTWR
jgi:hypothetical protein